MKTGLDHPAFWVTCLCVLSFSGARAQTPAVRKVEPPNWWIGLPDPVLLITGHNLTDAHLATETAGIRIRHTLGSRNGDYLLAWLEIASTAAPGKIHFKLVNPQGSESVDLPLERRNPAAQRAHGNEGFNGFGSDDVIYLIMPDRFDDGDRNNNFPESGTYDRNAPRAYHGGDLRGIGQRLPYLQELGVTTLWITPIDQNDDRTGRDYHGYGAVDLYAVEKHLGTLDDYRSLVKDAHSRGMKVILDIVPNHVGPSHPWVDDPPTDHWLHGTREKHLATPSTFDCLTDAHAPAQQWRGVIEGWFAGILPDMGTDDPVAAQYLRQNAIWWVETGGLDGFRLDTFPYVDRNFWHDFHAQLHEAYPRFRTVGEVFNRDPTVTAYFVGGKATEGVDTDVDTVFDFPLSTAIRRVVLQDAPTGELEEVLRHDWMFPHPENLVTFLGNHDTKRFMGEAGATPQKLKLAFSLLVTMRGIPQIYSGDEIGMPGGEDPDNRRDFPGGFPGDPQNAFTAQGRTHEQQDIFLHVRSLLRLRREYAALQWGRQIHVPSDEQTYAYVRELPRVSGALAGQSREQLLMVMNNADQPRTIELNLHDTPIASARSFSPVIGAQPAPEVQEEKLRASVAGRSLSIYRVVQ
jgi:neopullulanase